MPVKKEDTGRALELLEQYHRRLSAPEDTQLRAAIERVMRIFQSKLFNALIEIQEFYEVTLLDESKSAEQKAREASSAADRWAGSEQARMQQQQQQQQVSHQPGAKRKAQQQQQRHQPEAPLLATDAPDSVADVVEEVILQRTATGFGFSIAGGTDEPQLAPDDPRLCVTKVVPQGAADGRLRLDDIIIGVNGADVTAVTHAAAVDALKKSGNALRLLVVRAQQQQQQQQQLDVLLTKTAKGLGISIAGGADNQHLPGDDSVFVTRIIDGGAAQQDGRVEFGDRLLAVDGAPLLGFTHQQAVAALKATANQVRLTVLKPSAAQLQMLLSIEQGAWQPEQQAPSEAVIQQQQHAASKKSGSNRKDKKRHSSHEAAQSAAAANEEEHEAAAAVSAEADEKRKSKGSGLFGKKKK